MSRKVPIKTEAMSLKIEKDLKEKVEALALKERRAVSQQFILLVELGFTVLEGK